MKPTKTRRQAVRRVRRRIDKAGLQARRLTVLEACASPEFQFRLMAECQGATGDWIKTNQETRKVATKILDQMKVDHRQIELTFLFDPATRKLDINAHPAAAVVLEIAKKAKLSMVGMTGGAAKS